MLCCLLLGCQDKKAPVVTPVVPAVLSAPASFGSTPARFSVKGSLANGDGAIAPAVLSARVSRSDRGPPVQLRVFAGDGATPTTPLSDPGFVGFLTVVPASDGSYPEVSANLELTEAQVAHAGPDGLVELSFVAVDFDEKPVPSVQLRLEKLALTRNPK